MAAQIDWKRLNRILLNGITNKNNMIDSQ
jgi:hypothetical protein